MTKSFIQALIYLASLMLIGYVIYLVYTSTEAIKNCSFATRMGVCSCSIEEAILQQLRNENNSQQAQPQTKK